MKLFDTVSDLASSGYVFRIQDNGGATADRYTVAFCDGSYLGMSGSPSHPQGVSQSGENLDPLVMAEGLENETEVDLAIGDLPRDIAEHVLSRANEGYRDFLTEAVATGSGIAKTRDEAEVNEGLVGDGGKGIYATPEGYRVRGEDEPDRDVGPFETVQQALLSTLPKSYSLSGPEFHSSLEPSRLTPSPEVAEKVAALQASVEAAWKASSPGSSFGR